MDLTLLELEPFTLPFKESSKLTLKCHPSSNPFLSQYNNGLLAPPRMDFRGKIVKPVTPRPILKKIVTVKSSNSTRDLSSLQKKVEEESRLYVPWSKLTLPSQMEKKIEVEKRSESGNGGSNGTIITLSDYDYDEDFTTPNLEQDRKLELEWKKREELSTSPSRSISFELSTSTSTSNFIRRSRSPPLPKPIDTNLGNFSFRKLSQDEDEMDLTDDEDEENECSTPPDSQPPSRSNHQPLYESSIQSKLSFLSFTDSLPRRMSNVPGRLRLDKDGRSWVME